MSVRTYLIRDQSWCQNIAMRYTQYRQILKKMLLKILVVSSYINVSVDHLLRLKNA